MKTFNLSKDLQEVSRVGLGCMRIDSLSSDRVHAIIETALENGINFFDHADIYGGGKSEEVFGKALTPSLRGKMYIQTKCGIRPGISFDFSKKHIIESVDGSLKRLGTDHVDSLLLHRPDALMEPEEVAEAFDELTKAGKVNTFGVSNQNPMQMELLNSYCDNRIKIDQIQMSVAHCPTIDAGINVNIYSDAGCDRDGGIIEYSRLKRITLQAWSPFQYGMFEGVFIGSDKYPKLNETLTRLAKKYDVTENAVAVAWLLRHPAGIQVIVGTTGLEHIRGICKAPDVELTREEWYELYLSAGKILP